jgi:predicted GIY-YIG superfamily endonuclease
MSSTPKTIQIFLPSGEPHGIRIAEITTRIVQVIEVPRSLLADFLAMEQSSQVGVYVLVGEDTGDDDRRVYVGQTGDLRARLAQHHQKKDFWQRALVLISRTNSLTQTHALFLEWHALKQIRDAGRFADENGNSGSKPHTPAPLEAECLEIFETGHTLISSLGFPLFDRVVFASSSSQEAEMLFCRSPGTGVDGRGFYTAEGFVVLEGSLAREAMTPSTTPAQRQWRQRLIDRGVMQPNGNGGLVFTKDHLFLTPSGAAIALMARRANGWSEWKNAEGLTLHQLQREPQAGTAPSH